MSVYQSTFGLRLSSMQRRVFKDDASNASNSKKLQQPMIFSLIAAVATSGAAPTVTPTPTPTPSPTPVIAVQISDVLATANNTIATASAFATYSTLLVAVLALAVALIAIWVTFSLAKQKRDHLKALVRGVSNDKEMKEAIIQAFMDDPAFIETFAARQEAMIRESIATKSEQIKDGLKKAFE